MTPTDLRILYRKETGVNAPDASQFAKVYIPKNMQDNVLSYIQWIEDLLLKEKDLHHKLIPWEKC